MTDRAPAPRAPALGWGVLAALGAAAAVASLAGQLVFAALAIGVVGMAHGASDLAIVSPARRPAFLACYGATAVACLAWWLTAPAVALPLFLVASAIHFGLEDAPPQRPVERIARGLGMILVPAALHPDGFAAVIAAAGGVEARGLPVALVFSLPGGLVAAILLGIAVRRRDARLAIGTAVLLLLPPLVGFSLSFLILHALPQTVARARSLGYADLYAYVRSVAPILGIAALAVAWIAAVMLRLEPTGIRALLAAIAALAAPHLLVTPAFDRDAARSRAGGPPSAEPAAANWRPR